MSQKPPILNCNICNSCNIYNICRAAFAACSADWALNIGLGKSGTKCHFAIAAFAANFANRKKWAKERFGLCILTGD